MLSNRILAILSKPYLLDLVGTDGCTQNGEDTNVLSTSILLRFRLKIEQHFLGRVVQPTRELKRTPSSSKKGDFPLFTTRDGAFLLRGVSGARGQGPGAMPGTGVLSSLNVSRNVGPPMRM
eukprot:COSAG05_NODE_8989_length_656_cov_1.147217_1_plen_121_part_00